MIGNEKMFLSRRSLAAVRGGMRRFACANLRRQAPLARRISLRKPIATRKCGARLAGACRAVDAHVRRARRASRAAGQRDRHRGCCCARRARCRTRRRMRARCTRRPSRAPAATPSGSGSCRSALMARPRPAGRDRGMAARRGSRWSASRLSTTRGRAGAGRASRVHAPPRSGRRHGCCGWQGGRTPARRGRSLPWRARAGDRVVGESVQLHGRQRRARGADGADRVSPRTGRARRRPVGAAPRCVPRLFALAAAMHPVPRRQPAAGAPMFLGDVGAVPLGLSRRGVRRRPASPRTAGPPWFPLLVFLPFIADATLTLAAPRCSAGERLWEAHRGHYYQRLHQLGAGPRAARSPLYCARDGRHGRDGARLPLPCARRGLAGRSLRGCAVVADACSPRLIIIGARRRTSRRSR